MVERLALDVLRGTDTSMEEIYVMIQDTVNELIEENKKTTEALRSLCSVIVNTMLDEEKGRAIQEFQRVKAFVDE